jgi:hypothetical protein
MERLVLCSKTLYDKDLCDKATEIFQLQRTLSRYVTPVVFYPTWREWEDRKAKMHEIIETGVRKYVIDREGDDEYSNFGVTSHQRTQICGVIMEALMHLTACNEWSTHMASTITDNIDGFFNNLMVAGVWNNINNVYFGLRREQILGIVMSTVTRYLSAAVLNSIPRFNCKECGRETHTLSDGEKCFPCDNGAF